MKLEARIIAESLELVKQHKGDFLVVAFSEEKFGVSKDFSLSVQTKSQDHQGYWIFKTVFFADKHPLIDLCNELLKEVVPFFGKTDLGSSGLISYDSAELSVQVDKRKLDYTPFWYSFDLAKQDSWKEEQL